MTSARGPLTRQDLIDAAASAGDMPKVKAEAVVGAVLEAVADSLKEGREVRLPGFGTFSISQRSARAGRNPRTGETVQLPASAAVRFRPGKDLKSSLTVRPA
jgi:DNA-binding protein HU-beta